MKKSSPEKKNKKKTYAPDFRCNKHLTEKSLHLLLQTLWDITVTKSDGYLTNNKNKLQL